MAAQESMTDQEAGSTSQAQRWRTWALFFSLLFLLWGITSWVQRPPRPLPVDAPPEQFSEGRAMATVRKLADEIGTHPVSSAANLTAAQFLASELRKQPRLEVEIQEVEGDTRVNVWSGVHFHYRVRNVLARLPGRRPEALLINAHYDSPVEANGGADNGIGTAAALETMRALAASPQLEWTVVLNLNGGEEAGSAGAAGFLQHRFAKDVRAFIDTDGSCGGKANLMAASANVPALLRAYARAVPSPQATIFGNDFIQSGLTQASGDFEPLARAGLPGMAFAAVKDIWAVHTHLDTSSRLQPGTLQDLGSTILAVSRELARGGATLTPEPERTVYYDLLSQTTLVYSMAVARGLALGAIALALVVLVLLRQSGQLKSRALLSGVGWTLLSALTGLLCALFAAALVALLLQRPHGFYATPYLVVPSYVFAGLCGVLALHSTWQRRALARGQHADELAVVAWAASLLLFSLLLALLSLAGLGVAYLFLWWLVPSVLALAVSLRLPQRRTELWLASLAVSAALFIHLAVGLVPAFIGLTVGMNPGPAPGDMPIAVILWLLVVLPISLSGLPGLHQHGGLRQLLLGCGVVTALGLLLLAVHAPYSASRPKRVMAVHATQDGRTALLLQSEDMPPLARALTAIPEAQPVPATEEWSTFLPPGWMPPPSHKLPAQPLPIPPPRLDVVERSDDAKAGTRTLRLRLFASGWVTFVEIPHASLVSWSFPGELPKPLEGQTTITLLLVAPNPAGQELTLTLRGSTPVPVQLRQFHPPDTSPELQSLRQRLPAWTTLNARSLQAVRVSL